MSHRMFRQLLLLALVAALSVQLRAQTASNTVTTTLPITSTLSAQRTTAPSGSLELSNKAYFPDPSHIPFILPQDIPWKGRPGHEQIYNLVGDPREPGFYIQILKWWPGNYSRPHFHAHNRYIAVLSGTWWVSNSTHFDPDKTYPLPAGTLTEDVMNTVHWDGAKASTGPVVLEIVGFGPVPNVNVGEDGKPLTPVELQRQREQEREQQKRSSSSQ